MIAALSEREDGGLFINAGRGDLMTIEALSRLVDSPWTVVLDTWPGEPSLSAELLSLCDWVSPHIAGHSIKARENGSDLLAEAVARWAGVEVATSTELVDQDASAVTGQTSSAECAVADSEVTAWMAEFLCQQSILPREDARLREVAAAGLTSLEFDQLRKSYQQPAEWTGQRVTMPVSDGCHRAAAERLGLKVASE
tara:strand:- start:131 stop:721 length:591 start_codon:yes stop_codon:yes gene_type:complete